MQYCPKCKELQRSAAAVCEHCQGAVQPPQGEDPVLLAEDVEYEILQLCAALSEQDIPFQTEGENTSISSFKSRGFRGNSRIFVRYCDYETARKIAGNLGFSFPEMTEEKPVVRPIQEQPETPMTAAGKKTQTPSQPKKEKPEMSKTKQRMLRAFLMVCVLAAVAAVVLLSDTILGWIRGLFG